MSLEKPADIHGKKIIITGGTSGMGKILVERFPALGAKLVFFGRTADTVSYTHLTLPTKQMV